MMPPCQAADRGLAMTRPLQLLPTGTGPDPKLVDFQLTRISPNVAVSPVGVPGGILSTRRH